jgi:hypothetical protein
MDTLTDGNMDMETLTHGNMDIYSKHGHRYGEIKPKTEAKLIFNNLFTLCSCKLKLVVRPFVDEETNGSYSFTNGLNGLAYISMYLVKAFVSYTEFSEKCVLSVLIRLFRKNSFLF